MASLWSLVIISVALLSCQGTHDTGGGEPFPPLFAESLPFLAAIQKTRASPLSPKITGITVPHHLLAIDLVAEAFARISTQRYRRVIILSPDHFSWSPTPFAVARKNFQTALGTLVTDDTA